MYNTAEHNTALGFLIESQGLLSKELLASLTDKSISVRNDELFIKKQIAGSSNIHELLDSSTEKRPGVSTFEKGGRMGANQAAAFRKIAVRFGTGDDISPGLIDYNAALPTALANAELRISQEGQLIFSRTVKDIWMKADNENDPNSKVFQLSSWVLLRDDREVKANLHFPEGGSLVAAGVGVTSFIYVSFDAHVTNKK
tara:strand:- start:21334 stop:21930 length:597 start_codon:yes stop_codon:yes gene_type:complete